METTAASTGKGNRPCCPSFTAVNATFTTLKAALCCHKTVERSQSSVFRFQYEENDKNKLYKYIGWTTHESWNDGGLVIQGTLVDECKKGSESKIAHGEDAAKLTRSSRKARRLYVINSNEAIKSIQEKLHLSDENVLVSETDWQEVEQDWLKLGVALKRTHKLMDVKRSKKNENVLPKNQALEEYIRSELSRFLYRETASSTGKRFLYKKTVEKLEINKERIGWITKTKWIRWRDKIIDKMNGFSPKELAPSRTTSDRYVAHTLKYFEDHQACWKLGRRGAMGETALHLAVLFCNQGEIYVEIARSLLNVFPDLALDIYEGDDYYGESALHLAIVQENMALVELLIEKGAKIDQRATGRFFLPNDQKKGIKEKLEYTEENFKGDGGCYYGEYPLSFAACMENRPIFNYLMKHGAHINARDWFGNTVLHMMVIRNRMKLFTHALKYPSIGADINAVNNEGLTPLALAGKMARKEAFEIILKRLYEERWLYANVLCAKYPLAHLDTIGVDGKPNRKSALRQIVDGGSKKHLDMYDLDVIQTLLMEKWNQFVRRQFNVMMFLAVLHLVLLSVSVYFRPDNLEPDYYEPISTTDTYTVARYVMELIVCVHCLYVVCLIIYEIHIDRCIGFIENQRLAPYKCLFYISCILVLFCIPMRFIANGWAAERVLLAFAVPCAWMYPLFFLRATRLFPDFFCLPLRSFVKSYNLSVLPVMLYKMTRHLTSFMIIYGILLSTFIQAYVFLFKNVNQDDSESCENEHDCRPFVGGEAIVTLFQMSLGEYKTYKDYYNLTPIPHFTKFIFVVFAVLFTILLINLLISVFVKDHKKTNENAEKEEKRQWARMVVALERTYSNATLLQKCQGYQFIEKGSHEKEKDGRKGEDRSSAAATKQDDTKKSGNVRSMSDQTKSCVSVGSLISEKGDSDSRDKREILIIHKVDKTEAFGKRRARLNFIWLRDEYRKKKLAKTEVNSKCKTMVHKVTNSTNAPKIVKVRSKQGGIEESDKSTSQTSDIEESDKSTSQTNNEGVKKKKTKVTPQVSEHVSPEIEKLKDDILRLQTENQNQKQVIDELRNDIKKFTNSTQIEVKSGNPRYESQQELEVKVLREENEIIKNRLKRIEDEGEKLGSKQDQDSQPDSAFILQIKSLKKRLKQIEREKEKLDKENNSLRDRTVTEADKSAIKTKKDKKNFPRQAHGISIPSACGRADPGDVNPEIDQSPERKSRPGTSQAGTHTPHPGGKPHQGPLAPFDKMDLTDNMTHKTWHLRRARSGGSPRFRLIVLS